MEQGTNEPKNAIEKRKKKQKKRGIKVARDDPKTVNEKRKERKKMKSETEQIT